MHFEDTFFLPLEMELQCHLNPQHYDISKNVLNVLNMHRHWLVLYRYYTLQYRNILSYPPEPLQKESVL